MMLVLMCSAALFLKKGKETSLDISFQRIASKVLQISSILF